MFRFAIAFLVALWVLPASAQLRVDITRGNVEPLPIAITDFVGSQAQEVDFGRRMVEVVSANLQRSGLFRTVDRSAFIERPETMGPKPRFGDWRIINVQALVTGRVIQQPDGRLRVEFRLWDVFAEQQMDGQALTTPRDNWRRLAHIVSDAIYKRLTGEDGYFDTQIVYVAESGPRQQRIKRLAIMDQDGESHKFLTGPQFLALTPRFSPTRREITYLSYFNNKPRVYILNIDTARQEVLGDFQGMTFAPRFSPDGNRVIMSLALDGNTDIYTMDLRTRQVERLTDHWAIDTGPSYAPSGAEVVFESDRGGTQQIYVMSANGRDTRRISFGEGRYATPVWSPRGDLIAFTKFRGGTFYIGVMRPDGSGERLLSESFLDEGPTWSPNGRVLMFFRQERADDRGGGGLTKIWSVDLTGYNLRQVVTPLDASDPAWSPLGYQSR